MNSGGSGDSSAIQLQQQQQNAALGATDQINNAFAGFTPAFYQKEVQSYENQGMPQLQQQNQDASQAATFALANKGLLASGAADQTNAALTNAFNTGKTNLSNAAIQSGNSLQQQIAGQQSQLIGEAQTAADPGSVGSQAFNVASSFSTPNMFQPIGNAFGNFSNAYLANRLGNAYSGVGTAPTQSSSFNNFYNPAAGSNFGVTYKS